MRAFADALDAVPMALAENSGLSPIETLANIKSRQAKEKNTRLGVDCMQTGSNGEYPTNIFLFRQSFVDGTCDASPLPALRLAPLARHVCLLSDLLFGLHRRWLVL